jgi:hypothetical protein
MKSEGLGFEWIETAEGLRVRFPPPPTEQHTRGCATTPLVAAVLCLIPIPLSVLWRIVNDIPTTNGLWGVYIAAITITWIFLLYAMWAYRESALPPRTMEPSVLSITDGLMKIERAGRKRDMDYSWDRSEIVDVRLGAEGPEHFTWEKLLPFQWDKLLPFHASFPEQDFIRFSVEDTSGQVNDVMIEAPGKYWTFELEPKLRAYLGLRPDRATHG